MAENQQIWNQRFPQYPSVMGDHQSSPWISAHNSMILGYLHRKPPCQNSLLGHRQNCPGSIQRENGISEWGIPDWSLTTRLRWFGKRWSACWIDIMMVPLNSDLIRSAHTIHDIETKTDHISKHIHLYTGIYSVNPGFHRFPLSKLLQSKRPFGHCEVPRPVSTVRKDHPRVSG